MLILVLNLNITIVWTNVKRQENGKWGDSEEIVTSYELKTTCKDVNDNTQIELCVKSFAYSDIQREKANPGVGMISSINEQRDFPVKLRSPQNNKLFDVELSIRDTHNLIRSNLGLYFIYIYDMKVVYIWELAGHHEPSNV